MSTPVTSQLRKTALNAAHRRLGAKMVNFGGWDMPLEYTGILSEHEAVRTRAGIFDVSHMGEIEILGAQSLDLVQRVTCNDAATLVDRQIQYSGLMTPAGTFVDDLLVHRISATHYFLCVNASNQDGDFDHIASHNKFDARVQNNGDDYSLLAIQGPRAEALLRRFADVPLAEIRYYHLAFGKVDGVSAMIARTGYTGEDGFEIYFDPEYSEQIWTNLLEAGAPDGIIPCGLGARNTLRLEAGMCLYGHEIDDTTTPWEAGLAWICKVNKGDFLGRDFLVKQKGEGLTRKLVGFEMLDKRIGRDGYPVAIAGAEVGRVTSGGPAPFLKKNIGMAYVPVDQSALGTEIEIIIRETPVPARIVGIPFYKRAK